jgi:hypothetical protein
LDGDRQQKDQDGSGNGASIRPHAGLLFVGEMRCTMFVQIMKTARPSIR